MVTDMQLKNVVVTGATSMIGISLIEAILSDQSVEKVYAVVRPGSDKLDRLPPSDKLKPVECDIADYRKLPVLIQEQCDIFYHLAWPRTTTYEESLEDMMLKVDSIQTVLLAVNAASILGCRTFVGTGSQSEYGITKMEKYSPDTLCRPVRADGIIHLAAGELAMRAAKAGG